MTRIAACLSILAVASLAGCGSNDDKGEATTAKRKPAPAKEITIRVYSGREQPPPETWTASVGQEVIFTIQGLATEVGIVGPGLGEKYESSYGLTNMRGDKIADLLKFTPTEPGEYDVSQVESGLHLGTLKVE